jgi:hypothetical protein
MRTKYDLVVRLLRTINLDDSVTCSMQSGRNDIIWRRRIRIQVVKTNQKLDQVPPSKLETDFTWQLVLIRQPMLFQSFPDVRYINMIKRTKLLEMTVTVLLTCAANGVVPCLHV